MKFNEQFNFDAEYPRGESKRSTAFGYPNVDFSDSFNNKNSDWNFSNDSYSDIQGKDLGYYGADTNVASGTKEEGYNVKFSKKGVIWLVVLVVILSSFNFLIGYLIGKFTTTDNTKILTLLKDKTKQEEIEKYPSPASSYFKTTPSTVSEENTIGSVEKSPEEFYKEEFSETPNYEPKAVSPITKNPTKPVPSMQNDKKVEKSITKPIETPIASKITKPANTTTKTKSIDNNKIGKTAQRETTKISPYLIQVGAFKGKIYTENLKERIEKMGYKNILIKEQDGLYKVYINGLYTYEQALNVLNKIRSNITKDAFIVFNK